jgi:DNA-binding MarR family transcriptional regulator
MTVKAQTKSKRRAATPAPAERPPASDILWLDDYLPYRVAVVGARLLRESARVHKRQPDPLTTPEWRILGILANFEPLTASEISKISMLDKVAVSRTLARMVRRGFVVKKRARQDQRVLEVTLTKAGWAFYRGLVPKFREQEKMLRSVVSPTEIEALYSILGRFNDFFDRLDELRRLYGDHLDTSAVLQRRPDNDPVGMRIGARAAPGRRAEPDKY